MMDHTKTNIFFQRSEMNTLILDAHITFRHSTVHKYALQKVRESD